MATLIPQHRIGLRAPEIPQCVIRLAAESCRELCVIGRAFALLDFGCYCALVNNAQQLCDQTRLLETTAYRVSKVIDRSTLNTIPRHRILIL